MVSSFQELILFLQKCEFLYKQQTHIRWHNYNGALIICFIIKRQKLFPNS
jgi:hypothetical protein